MTLTPYHQTTRATIYHGDCLDVLRSLPDASVHSVVTDPPYNLSFMGRGWDTHASAKAFQEWCELWAVECLRILKPGGHMLAFGGTRTWHRLAAAVEDAGFEIRDSIAWLYGSGFPKSLDVSKAIDKRRDWTALHRLQAKVRDARTALGISQSEAARRCGLIAPDESLGGGGFMWFETGMRVPTREQYPQLKAALGLDDECDAAFEEAERQVLGEITTNRTAEGSWAGQVRSGMFQSGERTVRETAPATPAAQQWAGWGTALKPAFEPIVVARKPLTGTVAQNVQTHGTGALNIDACRVAAPDAPDVAVTAPNAGSRYVGVLNGGATSDPEPRTTSATSAGRWPANVVLDGTQADALDQMSGTLTSGKHGAGEQRRAAGGNGLTLNAMPGVVGESYGDSGGASRFFPTFRYEPKAPTRQRPTTDDGTAHATVKPLDLIRWLARLVTPPAGTVLEPFAGSGTTVEACALEGFHCIAIEREADYLPLITARLNPVRPRRATPPPAPGQLHQPDLFDLLDNPGELPA